MFKMQMIIHMIIQMIRAHLPIICLIQADMMLCILIKFLQATDEDG